MNIIQWKQDETSHKTCHFCSTFCRLSANSQDEATFDGVIPRCADSLDSDTARRYRSTTPLATADDRDRQGQSIVTAADNSDSLCATLQRNHAITAGSSRAVAFD